MGKPASISGASTLHDALQILLGLIEHAKVVQRAAAAEMVPGDVYAEACMRKYFKCSLTRLRLKVIVEGIRPENHTWFAVIRTCVAYGPTAES